MNKKALLKKIMVQARRDQRNRHDPRFLNTMGFLVAKGFLKANFDVPHLPNKRLCIDDAIWAGENVEPRILEVLPAAVLRLGKHFDLEFNQNKKLATTVEQLRLRQKTGDDFMKNPYEKIKVWADFPLLDKRVKRIAEKKVIKTFRLNPLALDKLQKIARETKCTETDVLEKLIFGK